MSEDAHDGGVGYADADPSRKISLLKKAVISLTKHKQELEEVNRQLTGKLATLGEELSRSHEIESALRNEILQLRAEVEAQQASTRKSMFGPDSVKSVVGGALSGGATALKGLLLSAPPIASPSATDVATTSTSKPPLPKSNGVSDAPLLPNREDPSANESLFQENEFLHIQLFELRTQLDSFKKTEEREKMTMSQAMADLQTRLRASEQRNTTLANAVDQLNIDIDELRAADMFCRTFLMMSPLGVVEPVDRISSKAQVPIALSQRTVSGMESVVSMFEKLTTGVSTFMIGCKEQVVAQQQSSTSQTAAKQVEQSQLQQFFGAHMVRKELVMSRLHTLKELTAREVFDHAYFQQMELEALQALEDWLTCLVSAVPLLVEVAVPLGSRTATFRIPQQLLVTAVEGPLDAEAFADVPRAVFVESIVSQLKRVMARARSTTRTMQSLVCNRSRRGGAPSGESGDRKLHGAPSWCWLWLDCLLMPSTDTGAAIGHVVQALLDALGDRELVPQVDERIMRALREARRDLSSVSKVQWWRPVARDTRPSPPPPLEGPQHAVPTPADDEEKVDDRVRNLTLLLTEVDANAMRFYKQLQLALAELWERRTAFDKLMVISSNMAKELKDKDNEITSVKAVYEEQIMLLSQKLTESA